MDHPPRQSATVYGDVTLDSDPLAEGSGALEISRAPSPGRVPVCLIEGSWPALSQETQCLLQRRLRVATTLLAAGFTVFLVSHFLVADFARTADVLGFGLHAAVAIGLGAIAAVLFAGRLLPPEWLRLCEILTFGLPAAFFLFMQYFIGLHAAEEGRLHMPSGQWLVLIYTYALFVPNTLRRASLVIGVMAAAPLALFLVMLWTHPAYAAMTTRNEVMGLPVMLIMAAAGGIFGVDTIGTLRRQAFAARELGQYRLVRRIGAGGMGEVYLAEHQMLKRPCVVKLIRPDKAGDPRVLARFQREVRATAKLTHWNTIEIFDYGSTADGTFFYVMEHLPGMCLGEIVDRFGPLPAERVIYLLRQACDALHEAHAAGLIHRDIKPGNIFAAQRGGVYDVVKVLDFGLVKPLIEEEPVHLTRDGAITGSPLFMSPEQAMGEARPDARSDIYSLGAVGYYLLSGRPPFESDKPLKVIFAHMHEPVVPPSRHRPDIPADLERVILRCLAKIPAERFADTTSLADALTACEAAEGWSRQRAARWWGEIKAETPHAAEQCEECER